MGIKFISRRLLLLIVGLVLIARAIEVEDVTEDYDMEEGEDLDTREPEEVRIEPSEE